MKNAFRVRSKQPDPNAPGKVDQAGKDEQSSADNPNQPADPPQPKGKGRGRGRGRRPKAKDAQQSHPDAKETQPKQDAQDEQPASPAKTPVEACPAKTAVLASPKPTAEKRKVDCSVQTPTKPSPNTKPSKKKAPKPPSEEAERQLKESWAVQDWKLRIGCF